MEQRAIILGGIGVVAIVGVLAAFMTGSGQQQGAADTADIAPVSDDVKTTVDGTRYTVHPNKLILGCSGRDCIPSIDDPSFTSVGDTDWLGDEDLLIGVERGGEAKAYPLRILNVHEIVNDNIGGDPVAVTYCPLCRSGLAYNRHIDEIDATVEFGVSGRLWNANLIMYDRTTETYWSQVEGTAVVGPLAGAELDLVTSTITEWSKWRSAHPKTQVLSRNTGIYPVSTYGRNPYSGYDTSDRVGFGVDTVDDRLHPKTLVYGAIVGNATRAYPEDRVEEADVIQDTLGGVPLLISEDPASGAIRIHVRSYQNETLDLTRDGDLLVDGDGRQWRFNGTQVDGTGELDQVNSHGFFWFAWAAFHPETDIYGGGTA